MPILWLLPDMWTPTFWDVPACLADVSDVGFDDGGRSSPTIHYDLFLP